MESMETPLISPYLNFIFGIPDVHRLKQVISSLMAANWDEEGAVEVDENGMEMTFYKSSTGEIASVKFNAAGLESFDFKNAMTKKMFSLTELSAILPDSSPYNVSVSHYDDDSDEIIFSTGGLLSHTSSASTDCLRCTASFCLKWLILWPWTCSLLPFDDDEHPENYMTLKIAEANKQLPNLNIGSEVDLPVELFREISAYCISTSSTAVHVQFPPPLDGGVPEGNATIFIKHKPWQIEDVKKVDGTLQADYEWPSSDLIEEFLPDDVETVTLLLVTELPDRVIFVRTNLAQHEHFKYVKLPRAN